MHILFILGILLSPKDCRNIKQFYALKITAAQILFILLNCSNQSIE